MDTIYDIDSLSGALTTATAWSHETWHDWPASVSFFGAIEDSIASSGGPSSGSSVFETASQAALFHERLLDAWEPPADPPAEPPAENSVSSSSVTSYAQRSLLHAAEAVVQAVAQYPGEAAEEAVSQVLDSFSMHATRQEIKHVIGKIKDAGGPEQPGVSFIVHYFFGPKLTDTRQGKAQLAVTIAMEVALLATYTRNYISDFNLLVWADMSANGSAEGLQGEANYGPPPPPQNPIALQFPKSCVDDQHELKASYNYTANTDLEISLGYDETVTDCTMDHNGWAYGTNSRGEKGAFPLNRVGKVIRAPEPVPSPIPSRIPTSTKSWSGILPTPPGFLAPPEPHIGLMTPRLLPGILWILPIGLYAAYT